MADLQDSLPTGDTELDEAVSDPIDLEYLRECTEGDEAFVEQLQESLRPL